MVAANPCADVDLTINAIANTLRWHLANADHLAGVDAYNERLPRPMRPNFVVRRRWEK